MTTIAATPRLGRYDIDVRQSSIAFRTRHVFGLAPVRGRFSIQSGTIDVADPTPDSSVRVEIDAASFNTGNAQRDKTVRSGRFLDVLQFPVITFVSGGPDGAVLSGQLTVRGVSMPVTLTIEDSAVEQDSFTARARTRIDRTIFGVTASRGMAGRYLDLSLEVRGVRR
jgi:polyisoprenoid-binding protein YceI